MRQRTVLDSLLTERSLRLIETRRNSSLLDMIADDKVIHNVGLKNVCAKVSPQLAERIDVMCSFLEISKRRFLEAAFIEACDMAERIMNDEGVHEVFDGMTVEAVEEGVQ